jgi:hypothetical protein
LHDGEGFWLKSWIMKKVVVVVVVLTQGSGLGISGWWVKC